MKIDTRLMIGDTEHPTSRYQILQMLSAVGHASFTLVGDRPGQGLVQFSAGYADGKMHRLFMGVISAVNQATQNSWTVRAEEISHALTRSLPIALRHCLASDVLAEMQRDTGLEFVLASDQAQPASRFFSHGNGLFNLVKLADVYQIPDFVWYLDRLGRIECGTWADTPLGQKKPQTIDAQLFEHQQHHSARLAFMPVLRPGLVVNGHRLTQVRHEQQQTLLRWGQ